ncbi:hypothetical protein [Streptomyces nigrescens]|uniref:hypothetical protein n=1 Tax=Streptomyces nigrescens TaxID=1920 RepID=UPI00348829B7
MRCPAPRDTDGATPFSWLIRPAQGPVWPEGEALVLAQRIGASRFLRQISDLARGYEPT